MLNESRERILREVADDALVLDIGGWSSPFPRADWVVDMNPFETRGLYGAEPGGDERFTADTWVQRDVCAVTADACVPLGGGQRYDLGMAVDAVLAYAPPPMALGV